MTERGRATIHLHRHDGESDADYGTRAIQNLITQIPIVGRYWESNFLYVSVSSLVFDCLVASGLLEHTKYFGFDKIATSTLLLTFRGISGQVGVQIQTDPNSGVIDYDFRLTHSIRPHTHLTKGNYTISNFTSTLYHGVGSFTSDDVNLTTHTINVNGIGTRFSTGDGPFALLNDQDDAPYAGSIGWQDSYSNGSFVGSIGVSLAPGIGGQPVDGDTLKVGNITYRFVNTLSQANDILIHTSNGWSAVATFSGIPSDGDTIIIGTRDPGTDYINAGPNITYTFKNTPAGSFDVAIGGSIATTIDNLVSKINTAGAGKYPDGSATRIGNTLSIVNSTYTLLPDNLSQTGTAISWTSQTNGVFGQFYTIINLHAAVIGGAGEGTLYGAGTIANPDIGVANISQTDTNFDYLSNGLFFRSATIGAAGNFDFVLTTNEPNLSIINSLGNDNSMYLVIIDDNNFGINPDRAQALLGIYIELDYAGAGNSVITLI